MKSIFEQFPECDYPVGELSSGNQDSQGDINERLDDLRAAAESHRQVREYARELAKPGIKLYDLCVSVEDRVRELLEFDFDSPLDAGMGFPTGCSLNNVAAHYTPNPGDLRVLQQDDVLKLDFGTQVNGQIIDSAFTITFDPKYDQLLECVRDSTNTGIKEAGIDVRVRDIGAAVQEVMESYEIKLNGKTHQILPVCNIGGHNIESYRVHAGKYIPIINPPAELTEFDQKLEEGEVIAIETFGSTGHGVAPEVTQSGPGGCSHYMRIWDLPKVKVLDPEAKRVLGDINQNFDTLPFCPRFLDFHKVTDYNDGLQTLCDLGIVEKFPPMADIPGSYIAQYEHTVYLGPRSKEIISRGDDY